MNAVEPHASHGYTIPIMTDDKSQEAQQELFQQFSSVPNRAERFPALAKSQKPLLINTTLEQILLAGILLILLLCGIFFLGVLRGKSLKPFTASTQPRMVSPGNTPPVQRPMVSAAPTTTLAALPGKPYTIQLVTYRKKEYADTEVNAVRKMGFASFMLQKGDYFQVYAGQYGSRDEAKKDLALFQSKYKDSFLTRRA